MGHVSEKRAWPRSRALAAALAAVTSVPSLPSPHLPPPSSPRTVRRTDITFVCDQCGKAKWPFSSSLLPTTGEGRRAHAGLGRLRAAWTWHLTDSPRPTANARCGARESRPRGRLRRGQKPQRLWLPRASRDPGGALRRRRGPRGLRRPEPRSSREGGTRRSACGPGAPRPAAARLSRQTGGRRGRHPQRGCDSVRDALPRAPSNSRRASQGPAKSSGRCGARASTCSLLGAPGSRKVSPGVSQGPPPGRYRVSADSILNPEK